MKQIEIVKAYNQTSQKTNRNTQIQKRKHAKTQNANMLQCKNTNTWSESRSSCARRSRLLRGLGALIYLFHLLFHLVVFIISFIRGCLITVYFIMFHLFVSFIMYFILMALACFLARVGTPWARPPGPPARAKTNVETIIIQYKIN